MEGTLPSGPGPTSGRLVLVVQSTIRDLFSHNILIQWVLKVLEIYQFHHTKAHPKFHFLIQIAPMTVEFTTLIKGFKASSIVI